MERGKPKSGEVADRITVLAMPIFCMATRNRKEPSPKPSAPVSATSAIEVLPTRFNSEIVFLGPEASKRSEAKANVRRKLAATKSIFSRAGFKKLELTVQQRAQDRAKSTPFKFTPPRGSGFDFFVLSGKARRDTPAMMKKAARKVNVVIGSWKNRRATIVVKKGYAPVIGRALEAPIRAKLFI